MPRKTRQRLLARPQIFGFQIAPMVDILMVLLVFFIVTWNFALTENELDVKIPTASHAKEGQAYVNQIVLNVNKTGAIILNRKELSPEELRGRLVQLAELYPDQAVILRGDEEANYRHIVRVLDICREAEIWNVAFATSRAE